MKTQSPAPEPILKLSKQETRRFLAEMKMPFRPNERLRRAMEAAARLAR